MLQNYLKIALRSLWRSKAHSMINILGLGLGVACCVLIVLFVRDEWTFDRFHSKADRIYRVYAREDWGENQQFFATVTPLPMGPALKENFPEVEKYVRINPVGSQVKVGENQFSEQVIIGGQDFFDVFDFELLSGDRNALHGQSNVVLTERIAKKYFGEANPIDQIISLQLGENFENFTVKAVAANVPTNSSIQFDILISDLNLIKVFDERTITSAWFNISPETYVLLQADADPKQIEAKFPSVFRTILGEENFNQSKYAPGLQPITDIHLNTNYPVGIAPVSNQRYSYILAAIALLILVVACINFVTLSVGRSLKRGKEVGIRKVVGAQRGQLITQFIGEAVIVTLVALIVGIVSARLSLSVFNELSGKQLVFEWNGFLVFVMLCLLTIIGLIAGSYPAFVLSGFKPISILKGGMHAGSSKQQLRKWLVGIQLVLSIFLVSSTLIMSQQLSFLQNKNLGFNKEQLAVVRLNVAREGRLTERVKLGFEKAELFKTEFSKIPEIISACTSSHDFGNGNWTAVGYTDDKGVYRNFNLNSVDDDYIPTLNMELVQGRNFSQENLSDGRRTVIVNEAFAKEYGWSDAVGKKIPGKNFLDHEIIGVVKDFNYASLYTKVQPLVMVQDPSIILSGVENINIDNSPLPKLIVRLAPGNIQTTIDQIKGVWEKISEGEEFTFAFVDQALAAQYRSDQHLGKIVRIASWLAMFIGSLGLYALASLAMQNRTKEISIRKVMGATEQSLLILLTKDYVVLIAISLLLSVPITWYMMSKWLESFEYRVTIGWQVFVWAGALSLMIALITISYQAIKTAWTRPAETLKYE
jgi:putative ABC transport system permease protein